VEQVAVEHGYEIAALYGQREVLWHLIKKNYAPLACNERSDLREAIRRNRMRDVMNFCLVEWSEDIWLPGKEYSKARNLMNWGIWFAASIGRLKVFQGLYVLGATHVNALSVAAENGHLSIVNYIIRTLKAPQQLVRSNAMFVAAINGHLDILKVIMRYLREDRKINFQSAFTRNYVAYVAEAAKSRGHTSVESFLIDEFG